MGNSISSGIDDRRTKLFSLLATMESESTCAYCLHRKPKHICGSETSPRCGSEIRYDESCDFFKESPGQLSLAKATSLDRIAKEGWIDVSDVVAAFRAAIAAGLPADDEMDANFWIATRLVFWINDQDFDPMQRAHLVETHDAIQAFESALALDREGRFGFFEQPRGRLMLSQLDLMYAMIGGIKAIEQAQDNNTSDEAALEYWETKLPLCDFLSTNPLISTLTQAGYSYARCEKKEAAIRCFTLVANAAPVNIADGHKETEEKKREEARSCLQALSQPSTPPPPPPRPDTAPNAKACFIATAVYQDVDAPEVEALRVFRDNYLNNRWLTRWLVKQYYTQSPPIAGFVGRHRHIRLACKAVLDIAVSSLARNAE